MAYTTVEQQAQARNRLQLILQAIEQRALFWGLIHNMAEDCAAREHAVQHLERLTRLNVVVSQYLNNLNPR